MVRLVFAHLPSADINRRPCLSKKRNWMMIAIHSNFKDECADVPRKCSCSHLGSVRTQASLDQSFTNWNSTHSTHSRSPWDLTGHFTQWWLPNGGLVCFICTEIQVFQLPTYNGMQSANPKSKTNSFEFSQSFAQDDATDVETRCEFTKWLSLAMTKPDVLS